MLEIQNISYSVTENGITKTILDDVSFVVPENKLTIITGQNGSGKSTLAKIIMGIIQPTNGKILFNGQDISNLDITQRAKLGFAFAFQKPVTFKGITVKKMLSLASGKENSVIEACGFLSKVGLCARDYLDREINDKLSGGELKRIELATVVARQAKINVCDEPEAGIDLWSFGALVNLFKDNNTTNLVISHQNRLIEIADQIVLLQAGKLIKTGTVKEIMPLIVTEKCSMLEEENNG